MKLTAGKYPIVLIIFSLFIFSCNKSSIPKPSNTINTEPDTNGNVRTDTSTHVYLAGFAGSNGITTAFYFKDGVRHDLYANGKSEAFANTLVINGSDIYIGGKAGNKPVYWKNGEITFLNDNVTNTGNITGIAVNGNDFYAVGTEGTITYGLPFGSVWKNGTITYLTDIATSSGAASVMLFANDVYITGAYTASSASGPDYDQPTYWKNGAPQNLLVDNKTIANDGSRSAYASGIAFSGVDIYVVGATTSPGGKFVATYWKNGNEIKLTDGTFNAEINCIGVLGPDVYMAGYETDPNGKTVAVYWKNDIETKLSDATTYAAIIGMTFHKNDVYFTGYKGNQNGTYSSVYWKNNNIHILPGTDQLSRVCSIAVTETE